MADNYIMPFSMNKRAYITPVAIMSTTILGVRE